MFAEAGMPSARELTRLVEECSAPAKGKASKEKVEKFSGERSVPSATMEDKTQDSVFPRESLGNEEDKICESFCCTGSNRFNAGWLFGNGRHCARTWTVFFR